MWSLQTLNKQKWLQLAQQKRTTSCPEVVAVVCVVAPNAKQTEVVTVGTAEENNPAVCVVAPNAKQTEVVTVNTAEENNSSCLCGRSKH